jgi:aspartyl-tRNA(Asn)/glutamyl-tRNA(Gln) amidotransferase subunit C
VSRRVDIETIRHIALLSRIELEDSEVEALSTEMTAIIDYFDKLKELKTEDVEPLSHALDLTNILAEDTALPSLPRDKALANAPDRDGGLFRVPKVLEE